MTILKQILEKKAQAVDELKSKTTESQLSSIAESQPPARSLVDAIENCANVPVIAEIKKASPSRGAILPDANIVSIAQQYQENSAVAISVLTESHYFSGSILDLKSIRQATDIIILRKDFIIDPIQIIEARAAGADTVLLIAAALTFDQLKLLFETCLDYGMIPLIEIHDADELAFVMALQPSLIGINNRNLKTMTVDIQTSVNLRKMIPSSVCVVGESGISSVDHIKMLLQAKINAFLIGTALMTSDNPGVQLNRLVHSI